MFISHDLLPSDLGAHKSKCTPPEGQFASLDFFIKKCRHDIQKLKFNCHTKFSNLSSEEWLALKNLSKRHDIVGTVVVWRSDLCKEEALRQLSDTSFYAKIEKDITANNQKIVKDTIKNLLVKQELPATATNHIITTPRTSCIYFLPKIHKPNNPGRPIVSACSYPTELNSSYLGKTSSNQWLGSAGARLLRDARHKRHRSLHGSSCRMDSHATKARSTLRRVAEQLLTLAIEGQ